MVEARFTRSRVLRVVGLLTILCLSVPASASDGRFEIGHACANGPGCFAGDAPGYPVEITKPASHILTSGLSGPIEVAASAAGGKLDLNGFRITGEGSDTGTWGITPGISIQANEFEVANGAVELWGGDGIIAGQATASPDPDNVPGTGIYVEGVLIHDMVVRKNLRSGMTLAGGSYQVSDCRVMGNGGEGIHFFGLLESGTSPRKPSVAAGNLVIHNEDHGVMISNGANVSLRYNTISSNCLVPEMTTCLEGGLDLLIQGIGPGPGFASSVHFELAPNICGDDTECP